MKVLIACEESQEVCRAFRDLGHEAYSCDILPCSGGHPEWHIQDDILKHLYGGWDMMVAHPPCTYICVSGNRWYAESLQRKDGIVFAEKLWKADIKRIALENPISVLSTKSILGKPSQIIQPWMFGHGETKATCLWLKNLPKLQQTKVVEGREGKVWKMSPSKDRAKLRSKTYHGIAKAMAEQWGKND